MGIHANGSPSMAEVIIPGVPPGGTPWGVPGGGTPGGYLRGVPGAVTADPGVSCSDGMAKTSVSWGLGPCFGRF